MSATNERLLNACQGKSASAGGLNLPEFREQLILSYPSYSQQIKTSNRSQLNDLGRQLTKSSKRSDTMVSNFTINRLINQHSYQDLKAHILEGSIRVNEFLKDGRTILHYMVSANNNNPDFLAWLLDHGAQIDVPDRWGVTPLMWATQFNYRDSMEILLKHGANPNLKDILGRTALHYSFYEDLSYETVVLLLRYGADPTIKDVNGISPMTLDNKIEYQEIIDLMRDYSEPVDIKEPEE